MKIERSLLLIWLWWQCSLAAESPYFAGAMAGISTLSADGRSVITPQSVSISLYKPENGFLVHLLGGVHLRDYLSLQGSYTWNRNRLTLTSTSSTSAGLVLYEQGRDSSQHALSIDILVYFRDRKSRVRPYLSAGSGVARFSSKEKSLPAVFGVPAVPPPSFESANPALRVAVGIDVAIRDGWALRYSFCETMRQNPISAQLSPPGQRKLANFQNMFGFIKNF